MFTVFIDDSGTDPRQHVAIASALIIPANRIASLDRVWTKFCSDEGISEFHTSECVAADVRSEFAGWDLTRRKKAVARARRITKNHGAVGFSFSVHKIDFDEVVHPDIKRAGTRYHYSWAIRNTLSWLANWQDSAGVSSPLEYIFDWMGEDRRNKAKKEIELVMSQAELQRPGQYDGHYSFRKRQDYPGLQCTDLIAWSYYQLALLAFRKIPMNEIAGACYRDFEEHKGGKWMNGWSQRREDLADWSRREVSDPRFKERLAENLKPRPSGKIK